MLNVALKTKRPLSGLLFYHLAGCPAVALGVPFGTLLGDPKHALRHVGPDPLPVRSADHLGCDCAEGVEGCVCHSALPCNRLALLPSDEDNYKPKRLGCQQRNDKAHKILEEKAKAA